MSANPAAQAPLSLEMLGPNHARASFDCGVAALNRYLKEQVGQDIRRRVANCYVAVDEQQTVLGFYTLAAYSLSLTQLPAEFQKKLPRYPSIPAIRIGRLAVDVSLQGKQLGRALLSDALARCSQSDLAAYRVVVDAKDESAARFYRHNGFIPLPDDGLTLFLPIANIKTL